MSKTPDEIFNWLTRNSKYLVGSRSKKDIEELIKLRKKDAGITLLCAVNHVPAFLAPFELFEEFLGEDYSFKKHLKPLIDLGLISTASEFHGREPNWDRLDGCVMDYRTMTQSIQYWIGTSNPNDL